jgi:uncharacterized protein YegL
MRPGYLGIDQAPVEAQRVFPFYVVSDVSRSMWDPAFSPGQPMTPLDVVEQALPDLLDTLEDDPIARDTAHLSLIAFGDTAVPVLPMTPLKHINSIPALPRQISTNYSAVFTFLANQLIADYHQYVRAGIATYTPAVYFLTDGNPQVNGRYQDRHDWLPHRYGLEAPRFPFRPLVVALGMGDVADETVRLLRSTSPRGVACVAEPGAAPGTLLRAVISSIIVSISSSAENGELVFDTPPGMRLLD